MPRPKKPELTPVCRQQHLIPGEDMIRQVQELERLGTWSYTQGLYIADRLLNDIENTMLNERRMARYFAIAAACFSAIGGRVAAFRFFEEFDKGEHQGGDPVKYRAAGPPPRNS